MTTPRFEIRSNSPLRSMDLPFAPMPVPRSCWGSRDLSTCQCLIVDQDMPRMTGLELVASLRNEGVEVPAILISGHVTPALTRRAWLPGLPSSRSHFLETDLSN